MTSGNNQGWPVHLALLTVSLTYGATFTVAKSVMETGLDSSAFIAIRVGIGALFFTLYHMWFVREKVNSLRDHIDLAICGLFGVAGNMLMFFKGLTYTHELNASVLMLNAPIFVLVFSAFMFKRPIRTRQVAGMLVAAAGAVLLVGGTALKFSKDTAVGDLLILLNAMSYAFYLVYVKRLLTVYSPLTVARWVFTYGILFVLPFGLVPLLHTSVAGFTTPVWLGIVFVVLATTLLAYFLNAWAVQKASPTLVAGYIYLQPVFATAIAVLAGRQELVPEKIIFALLIFTGVYLVSNRKK